MKISKVLGAACAFVCIGISCLLVSCASVNNQTSQGAPSGQSIAPSGGIQDSKEGIMNALKDNYDLFQETATFLVNEPGEFACNITDLTKRDITAYMERTDPKNKVDINSLSIGNDLETIIKKLGFEQLIEYQDRIVIIKNSTSEEIGLLYSKDGKEIILDITNSGMAGTTLIQGKWYYFYAKHIDAPLQF